MGCATFYDDATNKHESWKPTALLAKMHLPQLVYLPTQVAMFCTEEQRTFWEVYQSFNNLIVNSIIQEDDREFLKYWLWAATQGDQAWPPLVLDLLLAINTNQDFAEWCCHHLDSILGPTADQCVKQGHNSGNEVIAMLKELTTHWQLAAPPTTMLNQATASTTSIDNSPKPYSQYDIAPIKDYCGIITMKDIPIIWALFKTSKDR